MPTKRETKENKKPKKEINKAIKTLGIDLSIGKVKLCLLIYDKETKKIGGGWSSLPVNFQYVSEKQYDYLEGLSIAIEAFLDHHNTRAEEIKSIIFCTGGGYYMAPSFGDGMRYTASIIKMIFPKQKVSFIRVDGELINIDDIFELDNSEASAFGCTNYLGTSLLAMKNFSDGLAIDMGTISTSIIPIMNNKIDPIASYNPKGYMLHRYTTGKHIWFGVMHTSLIHITNIARTRKSNYNLILRSCSTNTLCNILGIVEANVVNIHVNESSKISELEMDYMKLAETIGLDIYSISQEELYEIAKDIYFQMVRKLSDNIRNILANMNYKDFNSLKVLAAGLGQEAFIIPSLMSCGFEREQIITITEDKHSNLWTATSVYGLALLALENLIDEKINVSIA
ncbi:MAG: hypothetical protein U0354_00605 [Candidatus Sericytochromatia bacterium]